MARANGQRLPNAVRRRGVHAIQQLLAAGIEESECCEQIAERFNISERSARSWLSIALQDLAKEAAAPRDKLLGMALRRRRLAMARALKEGDLRSYIAAADSEAKLLGLNAPVQTEHHVLIDKVSSMSKAVVDVVNDFFQDDPAQRARFIEALRVRLNAQLAGRPEPIGIVVDAPSQEAAQLDPGADGEDSEDAPPEAPPTANEGTTLVAAEAPDLRAPDVAPTAPPSAIAPTPS